MVFRNLRERFCIDDQDYQVTLTTHWTRMFRSERGTALKDVCLTFGPPLPELPDKERSAQQRLPRPLWESLSVQLRPSLCHQNRVQRGHRRDAQHPKEISSGRSSSSQYRHHTPPFLTALPHCGFLSLNLSLSLALLLPPALSFDRLQFIVECHGNTLLPQFLGMYRLTVDGVETYMVVTRNVFSHRLTVHRKYDLKVGGFHCDVNTVHNPTSKNLQTCSGNW